MDERIREANPPADVQFLLDALRAERQKVAELESMLKLVVGMCESIGSFSNGVTWQVIAHRNLYSVEG